MAKNLKNNLRTKILSLVLLLILITTMMPTSVLAAEIADMHTVTFMSYDGSKVIETRSEKSNISTSGPSSGSYIRGYTLVGWKTTPTDSIEGDNSNAMVGVRFDQDKIVYARYKLASYKLTISYNDDSPSKTQYYNIYSDPIVFPNDITKEHYTLKMWSGSGVAFDGENYYLPTGSTGNTIVNAIWEPDKYTIYFDSQGGSDIEPIECEYECSLCNIPEPQKDGYKFTGWYTAKTGGTQLTSSVEMPANDITYYAHWTLEDYLIELVYEEDSNTTHIYDQIIYDIESDDITLPAVKREGYFFDGWIGNGIDTPTKSLVIPKGSTGYRCYYAVWRENPCAEEHTYKKVVTPATTTSSGKIVPTCKYCGKTKASTTIPKIDKVSLSATAYTYDGNAKKPTIIVKTSSGSTLKLGTDYTVSYKNNIYVGTATAKIVFKGKYTGSVSKTFKIKPKGTNIQSLYPESGKIIVKWAKQPTQTSGYQIEYTWPAKVATSKTITVKGKSSISKTISNLKNNRDYYVRIRTYKDVNGTKYYSSWSSQKKVHIDTVQLSSKSVTMYRGQSKQLTLKYIPSTGRPTWKSSNTSIATVSSTGKITAKGLGKATITATYKGTTYKATINVTHMQPNMAALVYDYNTHDNYFVLTIKNFSKKTATILSGTTKVIDCDYKSFDRSVNRPTSVSIKPGESKKIRFYVVGSETWWDHTDFTLYYNFKLDGMTYQAKSDCFVTSKYKKGTSWVNTYRDKDLFIDWRCGAIPE